VDGYFLLHRHDTSEPCDTLINYLTSGNERNHEIFKSAILNRRYFMATINLRNVPDDIHRKAKARAAMEGVSLKQLILRLLEEYLEGVC
jgi:predicted HicB family RNase H-like nuclease